MHDKPRFRRLIQDTMDRLHIEGLFILANMPAVAVRKCFFKYHFLRAITIYVVGEPIGCGIFEIIVFVHRIQCSRFGRGKPGEDAGVLGSVDTKFIWLDKVDDQITIRYHPRIAITEEGALIGELIDGHIGT